MKRPTVTRPSHRKTCAIVAILSLGHHAMAEDVNNTPESPTQPTPKTPNTPITPKPGTLLINKVEVPFASIEFAGRQYAAFSITPFSKKISINDVFFILSADKSTILFEVMVNSLRELKGKAYASTRLRINDPALTLAATKGYHVVLSDDVAPHMNHFKKNILYVAQPTPIEKRAPPPTPQNSGHPGTHLSYIWSDIPFFNANLTTGVQVNQTLNANGLRIELSPPKSLASPWLNAALLRFEAHEFVPESLRLVRAGGTSIQEARLNGYEFGASIGMAASWPSRLVSEAKLLVCAYCMRREELSLFEPTLGGATAVNLTRKGWLLDGEITSRPAPSLRLGIDGRWGPATTTTVNEAGVGEAKGSWTPLHAGVSAGFGHRFHFQYFSTELLATFGSRWLFDRFANIGAGGNTSYVARGLWASAGIGVHLP